MGFKTNYNDITLKDFVNLCPIMKHIDVVLKDYNATTQNPILLSEVGCTVDDIPEIFADWYVEHFDINSYMDASDLLNTVYILK